MFTIMFSPQKLVKLVLISARAKMTGVNIILVKSVKICEC